MCGIRSVWLLFFCGVFARPAFAAISYPEKTPYSFATYYAGMQKYGIILARQCALSVSCLLVLGIKKCTAMRRAFHPIARVLLSATSLRNVLTLSMCVRGNAEDKKNKAPAIAGALCVSIIV